MNGWLRSHAGVVTLAIMVAINLAALVWGAATVKATIDTAIPAIREDVRQIREVLERDEFRTIQNIERISRLEGKHER
jgi:hypothetical protein